MSAAKGKPQAKPELVRFYKYKEPHTFWTIAVTRSTTAEDVRTQIALKIDRNPANYVLLEVKGNEERVVQDQEWIIEMMELCPPKVKASQRFVLKEKTPAPATIRMPAEEVLRFYSASDISTFWNLPVQANTKAKDVVHSIATKLGIGAHLFALHEIRGTEGEQGDRILEDDELVLPLKHKWDVEGSSARFVFKLRDESWPAAKQKRLSKPLPESPPNASQMALASKSDSDLTQRTDNGGSQATGQNGETHKPNYADTPPPSPPTTNSASPSNPSSPITMRNRAQSTGDTQPKASMALSSSPSTSPALSSTDTLNFTTEIKKLIDQLCVNLNLSAQLSTATYTTKLLHFLSMPNIQVQETGLRICTSITTDTLNQERFVDTPLLAKVIELLSSDPNSPLPLFAAWVVSNIAVCESTRGKIREAGAIQPLLALLSSTNAAVTEQALRAFVTLVQNDENAAYLSKQPDFVVKISTLLGNPREDISLFAAGILSALDADQIRGVLLEHVGVAPFVKLVTSSSAQLARIGASFLHRLNSDAKQNDAIREAGGLQPIVGLLKNPELQQIALVLIANLAFSNDKNLEAFGRETNVFAELVQLLANAVTNPASNETTTLRAIWALANLSVAEENQTKVWEAGALDPLIQLMKTATNDALLEKAAWTITNVTQFNDFVRKDVGEKGAIPCLVKLLGSHNVEVKRNASKALVNLALQYDNEQLIVDCGAIPLLVRMLGEGDSDLVLYAMMALVNLTFNEKPRQLIRRAGGLAKTINVLLTAISDNLRLQALKILTNLAITGRNRKIMREHAQLMEVLGRLRTVESTDGTVDAGELRQQADMTQNNVRFPYDETEGDSAEEEESSDLSSFIAAQNAQMEQAERRAQEEKEKRQSSAQNTPHVVAAPSATPSKSDAEAAAERERKEKLHLRRTKIALEILETERTYVESLRMMLKKYYNPMASAAKAKKPIVTMEKVKQIFSISEVILNYHSMLLEGLAGRIKRWNETQTLGDYFVQMSDPLRLYTDYVNNYNLAVETLDECCAKREFKEFLTKLTDNCEGLSLSSYLIMPIQRIPRYELLLDDLVRHTDKDHPDYENLCTALAKIHEIADYVDSKKRLADDMGKIVALQNSILGLKESLVWPNRRLVKQGPLRWLSSANAALASGKSIWIFLLYDIVITAKARKKAAASAPAGDRRPSITASKTTAAAKAGPGARPAAYKFLAKLVTKNIKIVELTDTIFQISENQAGNLKVFVLAADDKPTRDAWLKALTECVQAQTK